MAMKLTNRHRRYLFVGLTGLMLVLAVVEANQLGWAKFSTSIFRNSIPVLIYSGVLLMVHFIGPPLAAAFVAVVMTVLSLVGFIGLATVDVAGISHRQAAAVLLFYGVSMFVLVSGILLVWGAAALTRWRGEKWVKELDYVYLSLGSIGVLGTLARVEFLTDKFTKLDVIGPVILATAVVIRIIKTRAEIGGWNKSTTPIVPPWPWT